MVSSGLHGVRDCFALAWKLVEAIDKNFVLWDWNYWDQAEPPKVARVWGKGFIPADQIDAETHKMMPEILDSDGRLRGFYTADMLKRFGYDVVLCSSVRSAGDTIFCGQQRLHAGNVVGAARKTQEANLLGHCVTSWAIRIFSPDLHELELAMERPARQNPAESFDSLLARVGKDYL